MPQARHACMAYQHACNTSPLLCPSYPVLPCLRIAIPTLAVFAPKSRRGRSQASKGSLSRCATRARCVLQLTGTTGKCMGLVRVGGRVTAGFRAARLFLRGGVFLGMQPCTVVLCLLLSLGTGRRWRACHGWAGLHAGRSLVVVVTSVVEMVGL